MDAQYFIIDYTTGRVIQKLDLMAVMVTCRVLMQLPSPSFDIVETNKKKFVTYKFVQTAEGSWRYIDDES